MTGSRKASALVRGRIRVPAAHGLRRGRLVQPLADPAAPPLAVVVAPAGSGKSTLLAHVAEAVDLPVAWLTLDSATARPGSVLAHLNAAFTATLPGLQPAWPTADAALADLEDQLARPALLVIDDVHTVQRDAARDAIQLFIEYQPERLRIVLGSRMTPDLDLARRRLDGSMLELDGDALRFRTWEVYELFRECHQVRLRPAEVTALTQRTAGWAAGLQMFHLATHRRPPSTRASLLGHGGPGGRLTREYLARHVLDGVDPGLRWFLIRTSVLDELTGPRCDALLDTADAAQRLAELERTGLFTLADDGPVYHYHEVLRTHLLDELIRELGAERARALHHRAGALLESEGSFVEAIRSYCRAEDWDDVRRVLAVGGASLAREPGGWIDLLPVEIRAEDPWALLALARRLVAEGSLDRAAQMYQRAVDRSQPHGGDLGAAAELRWLRAWTQPTLGVVRDWVHEARVVVTHPRNVHPARSGRPRDEVIYGCARLAAGDFVAAVDVFGRLGLDAELSGPKEVVALLGTAVSHTLTGHPHAGSAREEALAAAKLLDAPALSRIADGLEAIAAGDRTTLSYLRTECGRAGDRGGAALLGLLAELPRLADGTASADLLGALERDLHELAAPALAGWAGAAKAVAAAQAGQPLPKPALAGLEVTARGIGPFPYALALLAAGGAAELARQTGARCGAGALVERIAATLAGEQATAAGAQDTGVAPARSAQPAPVQIRVRCLGGFVLELGGVPVDLSAVRPRHQELLRLLGLHANRRLHREQIIEWLWPQRDIERGQHSLQVAVSDLRKQLEPEVARGEWRLPRREGSGYRLVLDADDDCDVRRLEHRMRLARLAVRDGDEDAAADHLEAVIATYTGELLPDDGPAEWVVAERDRLRDELTEACERLAGLRAGQGEHAEAARLARLGLDHDRYRDGLWQCLIAALHAGGSPAAAATATAAYERMLAEIGLSLADRVTPETG